jgi:hypothetical protein
VGRAAAGRRAGDVEYDTELADTFDPLRFVARWRIAVPGLITTKTGRQETVDGVWR